MRLYASRDTKFKGVSLLVNEYLILVLLSKSMKFQFTKQKWPYINYKLQVIITISNGPH